MELEELESMNYLLLRERVLKENVVITYHTQSIAVLLDYDRYKQLAAEATSSPMTPCPPVVEFDYETLYDDLDMNDIRKDRRQKWHRSPIVDTRASNPWQVHDETDGYVYIVLKYYDYQVLIAK